MTQPDTLHARLRAELDRRLELARAALCDEPWHADEETTGWTVWTITDDTEAHIACGLSPTDAKYIALHDPADAVRRYQGELEVLERHAPRLDAEDAECCRCWNDWPCVELTSLAHRLGIRQAGCPDSSQHYDHATYPPPKDPPPPTPLTTPAST